MLLQNNLGKELVDKTTVSKERTISKCQMATKYERITICEFSCHDLLQFFISKMK